MRPLRSTALAACAALAGAAGCTGGVAPLECALAADCSPGETCARGACVLATPSICPTLQPTFASLQAGLLAPSCGSKTTGCHSAASVATGKLDLETDAWKALLGAGQGAPAAAVAGRPAGLLLVKPGDPDQSFLVQKLKILTPTAALGEGMPPDAPRSVCAEAVEVVRAWIAQGALKN